MGKRYWPLIGTAGAALLLWLGTLQYPGGSQNDPAQPGFDWQYNYLSDLFGSTAVNGAPNAARLWAILGMLLLCASLAVCFVSFACKIPSKSGAAIIKIAGTAAMAFAFLTVTTYHNLMVTAASILALISLFYMAIFVLKSKLTFFKLLALLTLLSLYGANYLYFSRNYLEWLPLLQKTSLLLALSWLLGMHYFTKAKDFN